MLGGYDSGRTHGKVAWERRTGELVLVHMAYESDLGLTGRLHADGVGGLLVVGAKAPQVRLPGFDLAIPEGDRQQVELNVQALGAQHLLRRLNRRLSRFLLVGVGSGISYTKVTDDGPPEQLGLGNSLGGESIAGQARSYDITAREIDALALRGTPQDTWMSECYPEFKDDPRGGLVLAHGTGLTSRTSLEDRMATAVYWVATQIARDVLSDSRGAFTQSAEAIVYVGTTVARITALQKFLRSFHELYIGVEPIFPLHAEYATALGAMESTR